MGSWEPLTEVKAEGRVTLFPELPLEPKLIVPEAERMPSQPCTSVPVSSFPVDRSRLHIFEGKFILFYAEMRERRQSVRS